MACADAPGGPPAEPRPNGLRSDEARSRLAADGDVSLPDLERRGAQVAVVYVQNVESEKRQLPGARRSHERVLQTLEATES